VLRKIKNQQLDFSIVTPSFNQLDWLRLCVASVRDQVEEKAKGEKRKEEYDEEPILPPRLPSTLRVEHIIQDAGSPGIEEFAREVGADFYRDGALIFASDGLKKSFPRLSPIDPRPYRLSIYSEKDAGMYDAINRGLSKSKNAICGWLNSDEQYLRGSLKRVAEIFQLGLHAR